MHTFFIYRKALNNQATSASPPSSQAPLLGSVFSRHPSHHPRLRSPWSLHQTRYHRHPATQVEQFCLYFVNVIILFFEWFYKKWIWRPPGCEFRQYECLGQLPCPSARPWTPYSVLVSKIYIYTHVSQQSGHLEIHIFCIITIILNRWDICGPNYRSNRSKNKGNSCREYRSVTEGTFYNNNKSHYNAKNKLENMKKKKIIVSYLQSEQQIRVKVSMIDPLLIRPQCHHVFLSKHFHLLSDFVGLTTLGPIRPCSEGHLFQLGKNQVPGRKKSECWGSESVGEWECGSTKMEEEHGGLHWLGTR